MRSATKKVSNNVEDEFSITMELQRPLLEDEVYNNEYEINYKKDRLRKYIKIGLVSIVLIFLLAIATWVATSYKPGQLALDSLVSDNNVTVSVDGNITFTPKNKEVTKGFILYPGAKVDAKAYAPLCKKIAESGYEVVIVDMPLNFAMLGANKAEQVINEHKNIKSWVIGGHSLGGVVASNFAAKHKEVEGVALLASYPSNDELKQLGKEVVSIWGSKDGVVNFTNLIEAKDKLPKDTTYVEIEGANHCQFGDYGHQKGDNEALISEEKQIDIASSSIIKLLESIDNN